MIALLGFDFQRGHLWPLFGVVATLFLLGSFVLATRTAGRRRLADPHLLRSIGVNFSANRAGMRLGLEATAAGLIVLALLGPVRGYTDIPALRKGLDIVICIDTSKSMLARDLSPDRLQRARREVRGMLEQLSGDRVALLAFSGDAREIAPLTRDRSALLSFLEDVSPEDNRLGGTSIGAALERALAIFDGRTGAHEAIVLLTDGEDLEGEGLKVAKRAAKQGIGIYVVGLGTEQGGKIPIMGRGGKESFLRGPDGAEVVTRLDRNSLADLATVTGGAFLTTSDSPTPLEEIYEKRIGKLDRRSLGGVAQRVPHDRYQWALVPGLVLALLALGMRERRSRGAIARARRVAGVLVLPLFYGALFMGTSAPNASAQGPAPLTPIPGGSPGGIPAGLLGNQGLPIELPAPFDDTNPSAVMVLGRVVEFYEQGDLGTAMFWLDYSLGDLKPAIVGGEAEATPTGDEVTGIEVPVLASEDDQPEELGPRFDWTDQERAHLLYAMGMVSAGLDSHLLAADDFYRAASFAGQTELRDRALYNRATTYLLSVEERRDQLIAELQQGPAPPMPPVPGAPAASKQTKEQQLKVIYRAYLESRLHFLELLAVDADSKDGLANLEFVIRRLRELEAAIQEEQEEEEEQEDSEDSEDSEEEGEEGEESEDENEGEEGDGNEQEEQEEQGEEQEEKEDEPLNELEEQEEDPDPEPAPEEQPQEEEQQPEPEPVAPEELTKEEMARLLDRLGELEDEQAEMKERLKKTRQVPVERDW